MSQRSVIFIINTSSCAGEWGEYLESYNRTALLSYIVGQPILFVLSGLMGDWIERRVFHQPLAPETNLRVATVFANLSGSSFGDRAREIEFWKGVIAIMTPFLALAGSIVTAYFTYLANLSKK